MLEIAYKNKVSNYENWMGNPWSQMASLKKTLVLELVVIDAHINCV